MNNEKAYFNAFNLTGQIGSVRSRRILNFFNSMEEAWKAPEKYLRECGLEDAVVAKIIAIRSEIDPGDEYEKLYKAGAQALIFTEENYPKILKEISNPPAILYFRGEIKKIDEGGIAIVGSRKFTPYGREVAEDIVRGLVRANLTIVSGLALGIDAKAHLTAIEASGRTIAVLGSGIDQIYPASNRMIAERIIKEQKGAILTELPLGAPPLKHHFPNRNRIIAGLTLGTVVIEAGADSGALITARHALEQNREVFAVPGSIYSSNSDGPHNLIKMGAKLITKAGDILDELNIGFLENEIAPDTNYDNPEEEKIILLLSREPLHIDKITKQSGLAAGTVAATLTILEMKGKVKNLGANQYVLAR